MVRLSTWFFVFIIAAYGFCDEFATPINLSLPGEAKWALYAVDIDTGETVINIGNTKEAFLKPGSLMKLFVSSALLQDSAEIDMDTVIARSGEIKQGILKGSIFIIGRGNPLLFADDIKKAAEHLASLGIKEISGDIVADDSFLDPRGMERDRKGPAYAMPGALGLDLHTVSIMVFPSKIGELPKIYVEPPNDSIKIAVSARTVSSSQLTINIRQIDDLSYEVSGNIPENSQPVHKRFSLNDPGLYAAGSFRTLLTKAGIKVAGSAKKGNTPQDTRPFFTIPAASLQQLIDAMNKNSVNLIADNLLLYLGAKMFGMPGTREKGIKAVKEFLQGMDMDSEQFRVGDGSGLSSKNRLTAEFISRFLHKMSQTERFKIFYESLPAPGEETLKDMPYRNRNFRVKTGQLEDAYALAGYGRDKQGRDIAFAYMVNTPGADLPNIRMTGAEILRHLAGQSITP